MPAQTERIIREIENVPDAYATAIEEVLGLMRHEQRVRDTLEAALMRAGVELPSGWIEWPDVIGHFRRHAEKGIVSDELRRNNQVGQPSPGEELELLEPV